MLHCRIGRRFIVFFVEIQKPIPTSIVDKPGSQPDHTVCSQPIGHVGDQLGHSALEAVLAQDAAESEQRRHRLLSDTLTEQLVGDVEKSRVGRCRRHVHLGTHFIENL